MKYFDLHCDTLFRLVDENTSFTDTNLSVNKDLTDTFDVYYQSFAVWTPNKIVQKCNYFEKCLHKFKTEILPYKSDTFKPLLSVEGADFISENPDLIYKLKDEGIFSLSLTWNNENALAGGVNSDAGLKPLGREIVKMLNDAGIILDVSHLNIRSMYDVSEIADNVIATHTYIDELFHHKRNINLKQMEMIKEKNGLIGLCFYPDFIGTQDVFEGIYNALVFCLENGFAGNIAFGSDFDGAEIPFTLQKVPDLYYYLLRKGIDEKILDSFFFLNAFNRFKSFDK